MARWLTATPRGGESGDVSAVLAMPFPGHHAHPSSLPPLYPDPEPGTAPLRVRIVGPETLPAWLVDFVRVAQDDPWIDLQVDVDAQIPGEHAHRIPWDARACLYVENRLHRCPAANPLNPVAVDGHGRSIESPAWPPGKKTDAAAGQVDVVLQAGRREPTLPAPRFGTWTLHPSLLNVDTGGAEWLHAVAAGSASTDVGLTLSAPGQTDIRLACSTTATERDAFQLQRAHAMAKLPGLLLRSLRKLVAGGIDIPGDRNFVLKLEAPELSTGIGIRALVRIGWRFMARRVQRRPDSRWRLASRVVANGLDPGQPLPEGMREHASAAGHEWADPCVVVDGGRTLVFFEEFGADLPKGRIACLELFADGRATELGTILEEPWHLSYPQVFRHDGAYMMVVESAQSGAIGVYRAESFPMRWTHQADLLRGRTCVDPTLFQHEGHWYLFTCVSEAGSSSCDDLFLFVGDDPLGPFQPHPCNPIATDVRHARPAGRLFERDGKLYRPAQDCAPSYGAGLVFREVTELSPGRYSERTVGTLEGWREGMDGCHTYSEGAGVELLDARTVDGDHGSRK